jgi:hypothetical protein
VEVIRLVDGEEKLMTRLKRGQYFGQKFFLTRQRRPRSATVRIPFDSPNAVSIGEKTMALYSTTAAALLFILNNESAVRFNVYVYMFVCTN